MGEQCAELLLDGFRLDDGHAVVAERAGAFHAFATVAVDDEQVVHLAIGACASRVRRSHEHDRRGLKANGEMRRTRIAADNSRRLLKKIRELLEIEFADEDMLAHIVEMIAAQTPYGDE